MSAVERFISNRIRILAYEMADHSVTGPTNEARADLEERIWEAWERNDRVLDRLDCMYFGSVAAAAEIAPRHVAMIDTVKEPTHALS
jgi:hypothetical protein